MVLRVRRRLVSEGGASLTSGSPRTSVVVTARDGSTRSETRSGLSTDARQVRDQAEPGGRRIRDSSGRRSRHGAAPGDGPLALREHAGELVELGVLVALARRTAVPLTDLVDALERRVGDGDGAQLGRTGLDDAPHAAVATEMGVGANGRTQHRTVDEVERGPVPGRHLGLGWGRFRIADQDLADRAHRKERALAVLVDRAELGVEDREIEGDLRRLGENDLTVDEIDDDDGHLKSVTFRSQVPPKTAVAIDAEVTC